MNDDIGVIDHSTTRTTTLPSGLVVIELQLWVRQAQDQPALALPWVRMTPESAAELVSQLVQTAAAAQGIFEAPPPGPQH